MINVHGMNLCENCFEPMKGGRFCTKCGYSSEMTVTDPTMLRPGSVLLGKYLIGKVIGKGGFGITYLAYDNNSCKKVAIKEYYPYGVAIRVAGASTVNVTSEENETAFRLGAEKFYNEAKLVSKFNGNPNIVGVYEFFYENDTVYFSMEYLKGMSLKEYIDKNGLLTPGQALHLMKNAANALMAAHSANVLHRDISPDNIIICDNGDIKLIDFGAARQVVAEHSQSFSVILKPGFAPLEQYQKKGNQGPWTDIYALGATIYYTLTGDIPEDPMTRLDDDTAFRSNEFAVNDELWKIISTATQLKIEDRYGDVFRLINDLNSVSFKPEPLVAPSEKQEEMPQFRTASVYKAGQKSPPVSDLPSAPQQAAPQQVAPQQAVPQQAAQQNLQPEMAGAQRLPQQNVVPQPSAPQQSMPQSVMPQNNMPQQPNYMGQMPPQAPPKKKKTGLWIAIIAVVVVSIFAAIITPIYLNAKQKATDKTDPSDETSSSLQSSSKPNSSSKPQSSSTPQSSGTPQSSEKNVTNEKIETTALGTFYYTGKLVDGLPDGSGYARAEGGVWTYDGEWEEGMRSGTGTFTQYYDSGNVLGTYEGEWEDNAANGSGEINFYKDDTDNNLYEYYKGNFVNGNFNDGRKVAADESTNKVHEYIGTFNSNRELEGKNCTHNIYDENAVLRDKDEGEMKNGLLNGNGARYVYDEAGNTISKMEGEWVEGSVNGKGTLYNYYDDGTTIRRKVVGEWKNGKLNGQGTIYDADGNVTQSGTWKDGEFVG